MKVFGISWSIEFLFCAVLILMASTVAAAVSMDVFSDDEERLVRYETPETPQLYPSNTAETNEDSRAETNHDYEEEYREETEVNNETQSSNEIERRNRLANHENELQGSGHSRRLSQGRTRANLGFIMTNRGQKSRNSRESRGSDNLDDPSDLLEDTENFDDHTGNIRQYLTYHDEPLEQVLDVTDILGEPSNIVAVEDTVSFVSWDVREEEPRGSYLYVLQQDFRDKISQVHRYFCPERRLDILAEICIPIATVYSNSGLPFSIRYSQQGIPVGNEAHDLNPAHFSRRNRYVEANEFLLFLQGYFDDMRV